MTTNTDIAKRFDAFDARLQAVLAQIAELKARLDKLTVAVEAIKPDPGITLG